MIKIKVARFYIKYKKHIEEDAYINPKYVSSISISSLDEHTKGSVIKMSNNDLFDSFLTVHEVNEILFPPVEVKPLPFD